MEKEFSQVAIREIAEGFSTPRVGLEFMQFIAEHLARVLQADYILLGTFSEDNSDVRTVAIAKNGKLSSNTRFRLGGSPCMEATRKDFYFVPTGVRDLFPEDQRLKEWGADSYAGVPLLNSEKEPIGVLAALNSSPLGNPEVIGDIMRIIAHRLELELERLNHQEHLVHQKEYFQTLTEYSNDIISLLDPEGTIQYISPVITRVLGYQPEELTGVHPENLLHAEDMSAVRRQIRHLLTEGEVQNFAYRVKRKAGNYCWIESGARIKRDESGRLLSVIVVSRDVTERFQREDEMRKLNDQLEEKVRSRTLELEKALKREELLRNIREEINKANDITGLCKSITRQIRRYFNADRCFIINYQATGLHEYKTDRLIAKSEKKKAAPLRFQDLPEIQFKSELQQVFDNEDYNAFVGAIEKDHKPAPLFKKYVQKFRLTSAIGYHIAWHGHLFGRLVLHFSGREHNWTEAEKSLLNQISLKLGSAFNEFELLEKRLEVTRKLKESEKRFRLMADSAPVMLWISDTDAAFTYFNRGWLEFTGNPPENETGMGWMNNIHPDDQTRISQLYSVNFDARLAFKAEFRLKRHDQNYRWIVCEGVPRYDGDGNFAGYIGSCVDIHDRKKAEETLQENHKNLEAIDELMQFGLWMTDPAGELNYVSDSFLNLTGLTFNACRQGKWLEKLPPEEASSMMETWRNCLKTGDIFNYEHNFRGTDGKIHPVLARAVPIRDNFGEIIRWVGINLDISDLKSTSEALLRSESQKNTIMNSVQAMIFYLDKDLFFRYVNDAYLNWFGDESKKYINCRFDKTHHPETARAFLPYIKRAFNGEKVSFEVSVNENRKLPWSVQGELNPDYGPNGEVVGCIGLLNDITLRIQQEKMLKFLNEASQVMASTVDTRKFLDKISGLIVPELADWFSIDILKDDKLELLHVYHKDPAKIEWARELRENYPPEMDAPTGTPHVLRTGLPEFFPEITKEMIDASTDDEHKKRLIYEIGFESLIIIPLKEKGKTIGAVSFVSTEESGRHYTADDFKLAQEFAIKLGMAMEKNRLFAEVTRREKWLDNLITTVPGVVWEAYGSPDHEKQRIDFVSDYIYEMTGYTTDEWLTTPNFWLQIVHPDDRETAASRAYSFFSSKSPGVDRFRWVRKDGQPIWVEAHSVPVLDENGEVIGMRGVNIDISAMMELDQKKNEFIGIASHELKTPLTSVKAYMELLNRELAAYDDPAVRQYIARASTNINKLNNLISDLLDVSRIEAGKLQFNFDLVDFDQLVRDSVEQASYSSGSHKIVVKGKTGLKIEADRQRLEQVFINLISNAVKYSPKADHVVISLSSEGDTVQAHIRDFGIGIPKDKQQHIFDRFFRVNDIGNHISGLGIGLYITSEIIDRHFGRIWIESEPGKGSVFSFEIPVRQAEVQKQPKPLNEQA